MATIVDVRTVEDAKALLSRLELQEVSIHFGASLSCFNTHAYVRTYV